MPSRNLLTFCAMLQDNMPGTDRHRHNDQSMTENVKEALPGTKEHEGANEGLGHKIAKVGTFQQLMHLLFFAVHVLLLAVLSITAELLKPELFVFTA